MWKMCAINCSGGCHECSPEDHIDCDGEECRGGKTTIIITCGFCLAEVPEENWDAHARICDY